MRSTSKYRVMAGVAGSLLFLFVLLILLSPDDYYTLRVDVAGEGGVLPEVGSLLFVPNTTAYLVAEPAADTNQGFVRWEGDVTAEEDRISFEMTGHKRVTAVFSPTPPPGRKFMTLTLACAGPGNGSTLPEPGKYVHVPGKTLEVAAVPGEGAYFAGWRRVPAAPDESPEGPNLDLALPRIGVRIEDDLVLVAHFRASGHQITLDLEGEGMIVPGPETYPLADGHSLKVTASPAEGWRLRHWEDESGAIYHVPQSETDTRLSVTATADAVYRAVFEKAERTLILHRLLAGAAQGDTLPASSESGETYVIPYGETMVLTAVPASGDVAFAGWTGDLAESLLPVDRLHSRLEVVMTDNRVITAKFVEAETRLVVEGTVDGVPDERASAVLSPSPGTYGFVRDEAAMVTLTAPLTAGIPFGFSAWTGELPADARPQERVLRVPMNKDRHITAQFVEQDALTLVVGHVGDGQGRSMPEPGQYALASGSALRLEALSQEHGWFGGWMVREGDGVGRVSLDNPLQLSIASSVAVDAYFGHERCFTWIQVSHPDAETVPARGEYWLAKGAVLDLEAHPPDGKQFHYWETSEGRMVSESPEIRVTLEENLGYIAVFGPPLFSLDLNIVGEGAVETDVDRLDRLVAGTAVRVVANAAPDSVFSHWEGNIPATANATLAELWVALDADKSLTAHFDRADFQLTLEVSGLEESAQALILPATGTRGYRAGTEVRLSAFPPPNSGITFTGWTGDVDGPDPEVTLVMDRHYHVTAAFGRPEAEEIALLTLLPPEGPGEGHTHPIGPGSYSFMKGAEMDLSVHLSENAYFGGWRSGREETIQYYNLPLTMDGERTLGPVLADSGSTLVLMLDGEEGGAVFPPAGIYRLADGTEATLTAVRTNTAYSFTGWHGPDEGLLSSHGRYTLTIDAAAPRIEIIAVFRKYVAPPELVFCDNRTRF